MRCLSGRVPPRPARSFLPGGPAGARTDIRVPQRHLATLGVLASCNVSAPVIIPSPRRSDIHPTSDREDIFSGPQIGPRFSVRARGPRTPRPHPPPIPLQFREGVVSRPRRRLTRCMAWQRPHAARQSRQAAMVPPPQPSSSASGTRKCVVSRTGGWQGRRIGGVWDRGWRGGGEVDGGGLRAGDSTLGALPGMGPSSPPPPGRLRGATSTTPPGCPCGGVARPVVIAPGRAPRARGCACRRAPEGAERGDGMAGPRIGCPAAACLSATSHGCAASGGHPTLLQGTGSPGPRLAGRRPAARSAQRVRGTREGHPRCDSTTGRVDRQLSSHIRAGRVVPCPRRPTGSLCARTHLETNKQVLYVHERSA